MLGFGSPNCKGRQTVLYASTKPRYTKLMENKRMNRPLLERLTQADICCLDCGKRFGTYSVGCSSVWTAECPICGETKGCTETRDYGYLTKGINELRGNVKEQSKGVADYLLSVGPIMNDDELDGLMLASYEEGDLTLKLTEYEVALLNECLDTIQESHPSLSPAFADPDEVALFESIEKKITDLYQDHCVKYELSPALKKFHELYGTYGTENDVERAKWGVFNDAFHAGFEHNQGAQ